MSKRTEAILVTLWPHFLAQCLAHKTQQVFWRVITSGSKTEESFGPFAEKGGSIPLPPTIHPEDIWQCLATFWVVTTGRGRCSWQLLRRGAGDFAQDSVLKQGMIQLHIWKVLSLRNITSVYLYIDVTYSVNLMASWGYFLDSLKPLSATQTEDPRIRGAFALFPFESILPSLEYSSSGSPVLASDPPKAWAFS